MIHVIVLESELACTAFFGTDDGAAKHDAAGEHGTSALTFAVAIFRPVFSVKP